MDKLKYGVPKDDDEGGSGGRVSGGGGGDGGTPGLLPRMIVQEEMNDIVRWLDYFGGNTPDVSPDNTPLQNSRVVARKNNEKFLNKQIKERHCKEIAKIPKGIVNKRKSSTNFNFPDTPPQTPEEYWPPAPPPPFDYEKNFPPLSREPVEVTLVEPREISFLFSDGSLSPLRNKLPPLPPLPSKPSIDIFSGLMTQITDEKLFQ